MKASVGITVQAVAFSLALAAVAAAQTPPVDVTAQSDSCFNQTGTIPLTCDIGCVSSQPCEDYHVSVCSNARIEEGTAGSANSLPGGTFSQTTCSEPTAPFGGSFTATGTWSGTNSVFFACVPSSLTGSTATFVIAASDKTGQAATTTLTVPVCTASGPVLHVTKSFMKDLVNGHVRQNDEVEFIITVTNVGSAPTSGTITVTDSQPSDSGIVMKGGAGPDPCSLALNTVDCPDLGSLKPGGSETFFVFCTPTKTGDFENVATVTGGGAAPASGSASFGVFPPRPPVARQGQQPLRDLSGRPLGNS